MKADINKKMGKFVQIKPSTFMMGSPENEEGRFNYEVLHKVTITKSYSMCATQVTQEQYESVMGTNPSYFKGKKLPVETVSFDDVQQFISKLNSLQDGFTYRLPTEAEWEYACRACSKTRYSFGNSLKKQAWYYQNSNNKIQEVGKLKPNKFGLYDMHGNVWEWCQDWYGTYPTTPVNDPVGPSSGSYRVVRGGSWYYGAQYLRSAARDYALPGYRFSDVGFRLVRTSNSLLSNPFTLSSDSSNSSEAAKRDEARILLDSAKEMLNKVIEILDELHKQ